MGLPEAKIEALLRGQSFGVPIARQQALASEERPEFRVLQIPALVFPVRHDVKQRLQGRAGHRDAAIIEITLRHALLRGHDVVHAIGKDDHVLLFRAQHFFRED